MLCFVGLDSEGIYRQPGNQSEREKLLMKFDKCVLSSLTGNNNSSSDEKSSSPSSPPLNFNQFTHETLGILCLTPMVQSISEKKKQKTLNFR